MMLFLISITAEDIVKNLKSASANIRDYTAKMESKVRKKDGKEEYKLYLQKYRDGWVYMEVLEGESKGGIAVYDPGTKKVRAKKGVLKVTLSPDDNRVRSAVGHRIYESHIIYFANRVKSAELISEGTLAGRKVYIIKVPLKSEENYGAVYSKYWIDAENFLPVMIVDYDERDQAIRSVKFMDVKINMGLKEEDFKI
jgi:outer membrane lipoprotein-sorting protein